MTHDSVADLLTRIKNALMRQAQTVIVPSSRYNRSILEALIRSGLITDFSEIIQNDHPNLKINLKYYNGSSLIQGIKQISKQGLRRYSSYKTLRSPRRGGGITLLSTPVGILTDKEAKTKGVGGELLCEIYE